MRPLLVGFLAGVVLAVARAPLGVELLQLPATSAATAYGFRAAGLGVVALGIALAGPGLGAPLAVGRLALGAALGLLYRGLVWERGLLELLVVVVPLLAAGAARRSFLGGLLRSALAAVIGALLLLLSEAERPGAFVVFGACALLAMVLAGRCPGPAGAGSKAGSEAGANSGLRGGELSALALAGAGVAIVLEALGRHLRLLGGGLPQEGALFGGLLALLVAAGAGAFAFSFPSAPSRALGRSLGLAGAALGGFVGLRTLGHFARPTGYANYTKGLVHRWPALPEGIAQQGTLFNELVLASPVLALPALLLGAGLRALTRASELSALLFGAALGLALFPVLLTPASVLPAVGGLGAEAVHSASLLPVGAKLTALGALLALLLARRLGRLAGVLGAAACLGAAVAAFLLPAPRTLLLSPWEQRIPAPELVLDTPEGLLTVEPSGGGIDCVTLDRREIAPRLEQAALDREQIESAWLALPSELRAGPELRVLLVGQLTPGRALTLSELGATRIDRSASWHASMPALEEVLFRGFELPQGEVLRPAEARRRIAAGAYELVLVPSVAGPAPTTRGLGWPRALGGAVPAPRTVAVVWIDSRRDLAHRALGARVLCCTADLEDLALGIVYASPPGLRPELPGALEAGRPIPAADPLSTLLLRRELRPIESRRRIARRLAGANQEGRAGLLADALARFYAEQRPGSTYEKRAQRVVLSAEVLHELREAAMSAAALDPFLTQVIEALAAILRGKRAVEEILEVLEPIADRHPGWPALEEALAYADLELLEPELAAQRMEWLLEERGPTAERLLLAGEGRAQNGEPRLAAAHFRRAWELEPGNRDLRRRLAIQLVLAGEPEGGTLVRELLAEQPEDEELRAFLGPGPYPELPRGYPLHVQRHEDEEPH